jgi:hypothetical protein
MNTSSRYRSRAIADNVIAFSISYQRNNILARGMGLEHLRELLIRLARPILRQGADLAYGGNWKETEENFTFELLRLITAEQEDNSLGGPDSSLQIGKLYNHSAWPHYLEITPKIEAQWINCCRIVRITQQQAGIAVADIVADRDAEDNSPRTIFNKAVTLSAMRRLMMQEMQITIPDVRQPERIPPVIARILLGGQAEAYSGLMPGIFEEALVTFENHRPLYILGGFGGAAEILADAILMPGNDRPEKLILAWHKEHNAHLAKLLESCHEFSLPADIRPAEKLFDDLFAFVLNARTDTSCTLNTGLSDPETRELLKTRNVANAVRLVRTGLMNQRKLPNLPA